MMVTGLLIPEVGCPPPPGPPRALPRGLRRRDGSGARMREPSPNCGANKASRPALESSQRRSSCVARGANVRPRIQHRLHQPLGAGDVEGGLSSVALELHVCARIKQQLCRCLEPLSRSHVQRRSSIVVHIPHVCTISDHFPDGTCQPGAHCIADLRIRGLRPHPLHNAGPVQLLFLVRPGHAAAACRTAERC